MDLDLRGSCALLDVSPTEKPLQTPRSKGYSGFYHRAWCMPA